VTGIVRHILNAMARRGWLAEPGTYESRLCPVHQEKTPSCRVDLKTGRYFCFGCGSEGDWPYGQK
jgi:DNA primase